MSLRAQLAVASALLAAAPAAKAMDGEHHAGAGPRDTPVGIGFAAFSPTGVQVVTGEQVTWTNGSVRPHDVAADDGSFDSGRMPPGAAFTQRFEIAGSFAFHCSLHPGMTGRVVVSDLLLVAPGTPVGPGRPVAVRGRTGLPAGTPVTVQELRPGAARTRAGSSVVGADGTFAVEVRPATTATYVAEAAGAESAPVTLVVLDRRVTGTVRRTARRAAVTAAVAPRTPNGTVVLQARSPEHFGWYPLLRRKLDAASRVRFSIPLRRRLPLRVVLTLPDGATVLAASPPLGPGR